jgi:competence protein ComEC
MPFLRVLFFFLLGIIAQTCFEVPYSILGILALLFFVIATRPVISKSYDFRFLFGVGLALTLFASAACLTQQAWEKSEWNDTQIADYQARIIDDPVRKPKTMMCKVRLLDIDKQVVVYVPIDEYSENLVAGDRIDFRSELVSAPPYQKRRGIAASGFVRWNEWQAVHHSRDDGHFFENIQIKALSVRQNLIHRLQSMIHKPDSYSVAAGLVFGYRNEIDKELQETFARIGAAHILAISGSHFAILFGTLYFILSFGGNSRKAKITKQVLLIPLMWGFAFLTGLSPSVIRAALMLMLWGIGEAMGVRSLTLNTVFAAAFLMLIFQPLFLFDVGFQLSFAAVIAIILINPYLVKQYKSRNPLIQYVWELSCVSVSAQLGVLPLSLYYFRQFPVLFLLTNLLLIPLSAVLIIAIPVALILQVFLGDAAVLVVPLNWLLEAFINIARSLDINR